MSDKRKSVFIMNRAHSIKQMETSISDPNEFQKLSVPENKEYKFDFKGALSGLRQFLATESPLKMMKNAFYFTSKALFVLKIFKFLS